MNEENLNKENLNKENLNKENLNDEQQTDVQDESVSTGDSGQAQVDTNNQETGDLRDEVNKYKNQAEEYLRMAQRVQADFDNFRKRTLQERDDLMKYCSMRLATNLLPILDNFERAMSAAGNDFNQFKEGIELIHRQLKDVLGKEGVKPMEAVGQEFDPNFHEAVMQVPSAEHPDNVVIEELQKGYMLADRVIRPAMVKVAQN